MTSIAEADFDQSIIDGLKTNISAFIDNASHAEKAAEADRQTARNQMARAATFRRRAAQYQRLLALALGQESTPAEPDPAAERAALIAGLRALADFLEDNPDVPAETRHGMTVYVRGEDRAAEVDRIAEVLGVTAGTRWAGATGHSAMREFGPVTYEAVAHKVYEKPTEDAPAESEVSK